VDIAEVSLTRGQVNAVRAAFKAGITPNPYCATDDQTNNLGGGKQPGGLAKAQASYVMWWPGCCFVLPLPLNSSMRPAGDGKISPPVVIFSLTWCRPETRRETRNSSYISGSAKYDRRAYRSSTQTFRGQSAHYCIERISSRSWNDDSILSSSS
jgi:hypothetical protein